MVMLIKSCSTSGEMRYAYKMLAEEPKRKGNVWNSRGL